MTALLHPKATLAGMTVVAELATHTTLTTYQVRDPKGDLAVLKALTLPTDATRDAFQQSAIGAARKLALLSSSPVKKLFTNPHTVFVLLAWQPGHSLAERPRPVSVGWMAQLFEQLAVLHAQGLHHGAVSAEHVVLQGQQLALIGGWRARLATPSLSSMTDIFDAATLLFRLLYGEPWSPTAQATIRARGGLPRPALWVLEQALHADPRQRPTAMEAFQRLQLPDEATVLTSYDPREDPTVPTATPSASRDPSFGALIGQPTAPVGSLAEVDLRATAWPPSSRTRHPDRQDPLLWVEPAREWWETSKQRGQQLQQQANHAAQRAAQQANTQWQRTAQTAQQVRQQLQQQAQRTQQRIEPLVTHAHEGSYALWRRLQPYLSPLGRGIYEVLMAMVFFPYSLLISRVLVAVFIYGSLLLLIGGGLYMWSLENVTVEVDGPPRYVLKSGGLPGMVMFNPATHEDPFAGLPQVPAEVLPVTETAAVSDAPTAETPADVATWLAAAEERIADRRLTTPAEDSALFFLQKVIEQDPNNGQAKQGLARIADNYATLAQRRVEQQGYAQALRFVELGLSVQASHSALLELEAQANRGIARQRRERRAAAAKAAEAARTAAEAPPPSPPVANNREAPRRPPPDLTRPRPVPSAENPRPERPANREAPRPATPTPPPSQPMSTWEARRNDR